MEKECMPISKRIDMLRTSRILMFALCIVNFAPINIKIISIILMSALIINIFRIILGVNRQLDKSIEAFHNEEFKKYSIDNKILSITQQKNYFFIKSKYYIETIEDKICKVDIELFQFEIYKSLLTPFLLIIVIGVKSIFL